VGKQKARNQKRKRGGGILGKRPEGNWGAHWNLKNRTLPSGGRVEKSGGLYGTWKLKVRLRGGKKFVVASKDKWAEHSIVLYYAQVKDGEDRRRLGG